MSTDDGWTVVTATKKVRNERKKAEKRERILASGDEEAIAELKKAEKAANKAKARAEKEIKDAEKVQKIVANGGDPAKAKKAVAAASSSAASTTAKKAPSGPKTGTEEELVETVRGLVASVPYALTLAGVGSRIDDATGKKWNTSFKKKYGSIKSFLEKHNTVFQLDGDNVLLVERIQAAAAEAKKQQEKKQQQEKKGKAATAPAASAAGGAAAAAAPAPAPATAAPAAAAGGDKKGKKAAKGGAAAAASASAPSSAKSGKSNESFSVAGAIGVIALAGAVIAATLLVVNGEFAGIKLSAFTQQ